MKSPKTTDVHAEIMGALKQANIVVDSSDDSHIKTAGGCHISLRSRPYGSFSSRDDRTRLIQLRGGSYGDGMHRTYRLRKDGTYNIQGLTATVGDFHTQITVMNARRAEEAARRKVAESQRTEAAEELAVLLGATPDQLMAHAPRPTGAPISETMRVGVVAGGEVFVHLNFDSVEEAKAILSKIIEPTI